MNNLAFTLGLNLLLAVGMFAVFLTVFGLLAPKEKKDNLMDVAVRRFKSTSSFSRLKPDEKFLDRVAVFCLHMFRLESSLEEMHMLLGSPDKPQPVDILYTKIIAAMAIPAAMMLLFQAVWPVVLVPLCFYVPDVLIKSKIQQRQAEILGNFSTTVDLAALIIESGLDYLTAFERIIKIAKEKTILEEELEKTINEIKLGYSRREALERFSARTGVQEVRSLVGLIIQSDELGTSLVDLLRNFSSDLRSRRLSRAEKLAAQASTKMLFPLFMFIFPTIFILILAPMIMGLVSGGMGF
ncbi:MAG: type II secretion system F family protein [Elusimicrobiales bacterium]|nr:type II secretion system F family protein [Elusimicrobiota bacterium]MDD7578643.1 type II secretion system F family protein [Elusimicrobiota bacterium]MDO5765125.1 type II secretion system F family protein [Elusimicrobiales bacterium]MDY6040271.1 type II secretion system F family protein [Elusimicrobiaceae bacterium]